MEAKIPLKQSIAESFGFLKAPLFTESLPPAWSISCKYNAGTYDIESIDRVGLGGPLRLACMLLPNPYPIISKRVCAKLPDHIFA